MSSGEAEKAAGAFDSEPPIQLPRPVSPHAGLVFAAAHESGIDPNQQLDHALSSRRRTHWGMPCRWHLFAVRGLSNSVLGFCRTNGEVEVTDADLP